MKATKHIFSFVFLGFVAITYVHGQSASPKITNKVATDSTYYAALKLQQMVAGAKDLTTLRDYHKVGTEVKVGITSLIRGCKMVGPAHDTLHHWLLPLIEMNTQLLESQSEQQAKTRYETLKKQIQKYPFDK